MIGGDLTAYHGGQVSLDPRPHIRREPSRHGRAATADHIDIRLADGIRERALRSALGDALSASCRMDGGRRTGGQCAARGNPAIIVIKVGLSPASSMRQTGSLSGTSWRPMARAWPGIAAFISILLSMNLLLAVLNLIPLPPSTAAPRCCF